MPKIKYAIATIATVLLLISSIILIARNTYPKDVRVSLRLSGDNRQELETVLKKYRNKDRLKYKAACFLIANMKYHGTLLDTELTPEHHRYFKKADSLYHAWFGSMSLKQIRMFETRQLQDEVSEFAKEYDQINKPTHTKGKPDLLCMKADFLIDNIEEAFNVWLHNPLLQGMSFDDFKTFILPYRSSYEELSYKRSFLRNMFERELTKDGFLPVQHQIERYMEYVNKMRWISSSTARDTIGPYSLFISRLSMSCELITTWSCNLLRSCGIPTVFEYTPQWPDRERQHFWCATPDSVGIISPFTVPDNNLMGDWNSIRRSRKVYRTGFAPNLNAPFFLRNKGEAIPGSLYSPLISDQTERYNRTMTLRLPFTAKTKNKLAYLALFGPNGAKPVAWGIIDKKRKEVVFEQCPVNTVFFPMYYEGESLVSFGEPFEIQANEQADYLSYPMSREWGVESRAKRPKPAEIRLKNDYLLMVKGDNKGEPANGLKYIPARANQNEQRSFLLLRKYPEKGNQLEDRENLVNSYFFAYNDNQQIPDTLYRIPFVPEDYIQEVVLNNQKKYRYYRFKTALGNGVNINEMEFLGPFVQSDLCSRPIMHLPIFSPDDTLRKEDPLLFKIVGRPSGGRPAFDDNLLTGTSMPVIGMNYAQPVCITHVRFLPRSGNNMIDIGDSYNFFYYDRQWVSAGVQTAKYNYLIYDNIPSGTIYWLRNLTKGNEELPFYFHNGKQVFINDDPRIKKEDRHWVFKPDDD